MIDTRFRPIFCKIRSKRSRSNTSSAVRICGQTGLLRLASDVLSAIRLGLTSLAIGQLACTAIPRTASIETRSKDSLQGTHGRIAPFRFDSWAVETRSPRIAEPDASLQELQENCGLPDAALQAVADRLARDEGFGSRPDDLDRLAFALRASGSPYVWPRAWSLVVPDSETNGKVLTSRLRHWLSSFDDGGQRRCGLSRVKGQTETTYAAVASDIVADLVRPLPTRVRTGQWLDLQVQLLREASESKVILEGTRDEPQAVPATIVNNQVHARFPIPGPGPWLIQVLATMDTGPRPVVEAQIFADQEPPKELEFLPAPGESSKGSTPDLAGSLFIMLNAARLEEGRKPLSRDARLDQLAKEHAMAMLAAGHIGHDVGDGSPKARLENAGMFAALAGENVAHAADVIRTHRALWASPSHRSNILHRGFRNVGLAVIRAPDTTVWACELFAALD